MELKNAEDARFLVHHEVTEEKLLHLERGVRKLGLHSGEDRILKCLLLFGAAYFINSSIFGGMGGGLLSVLGIISLLAALIEASSIFEARLETKRRIHLQYEAIKKDLNCTWEYRFYETCYEVIGKNEVSQVQYSNLGRLLEFTGMLVLVERGNVVRYFMKEDVEKGTADELVDFLERKSGAKLGFGSAR